MRKVFVILIGAVALATADPEEDVDRSLWGDSYLKVKTSTGYVQGYLEKSRRTDKPFVGFRGIPYAEPPLGELRFKDPVPQKPWEGIWDATYQRMSCMQDTIDSPYGGPDGFGEDCLYLNVYTPNLNYLKWGVAFPKAVMVFIHPGAFTTGSSTERVFSPDFLIDQDVIVVTFNYRLGVLGFLSLQNEEVPGNAGLKDQTLVLKWVKENIKSFGGDPSRVTIFGESAGSASVNFHLLSKSSAGLFNNAIMQSGSVLAPWAYTTPELSLKKGINIAKKVGCNKKDLKELLSCLQKVPAETIRKQQLKALTLGELFTMRIIAFEPTTEPDLPGAFLTAHPYDLLLSGNFTKVPTIIGSTTDEGLLVYPTLMKNDPRGLLITLLGMDLSRFAPYHFHLIPFTKPAIMTHQMISKFYFNQRMVTKAAMSKVMELLTDVMFTVPIQLTASMLAEKSVPVYNYQFSYEGEYNLGKIAGDMMYLPGVSHGDDLGYLFYTPEIHGRFYQNKTDTSRDDSMINLMTKMWANFAKTSNPTPKVGLFEPTLKWKQFTSTERNYLDIQRYPVLCDSLKLANMLFWEDLIIKLIEIRKPGQKEEAIDRLEMSDRSSN